MFALTIYFFHTLYLKKKRHINTKHTTETGTKCCGKKKSRQVIPKTRLNNN